MGEAGSTIRNVTSFDEAFRRKAKEDGQQQSADAQNRAVLENAATHVKQALRDFARALNGRVPPTEFEYEVWDPRRGNRHRPTGKICSPPGYPLGGNVTVTPEGSLWEARSSTVTFKYRTGFLLEPSYAERTSWRGDYVEITADALLHGQIRLGRDPISLNWHLDGRPEVDSRTTPIDVTLEPVEDVLAGLAHELINRHSGRH